MQDDVDAGRTAQPRSRPGVAGTIADLVLLHPSTVVDRSFSEPTALAIGIEKVLVAGELVWDAGKPVAISQKRPGRVMATPN